MSSYWINWNCSMANKLWDKGYDEDARIDAFTVGRDRELDLELAPYDILGTMAHITMLWICSFRSLRLYIQKLPKDDSRLSQMWRMSIRKSS